MQNLAMMPQYAEILTALETAWNTVQTEKTMRVVLIEGASGMKKSSLVYQFLRTGRAPYIVGRGSGVPEPYLPLRMVYESMLALEVVQAQLQKSREDLPQEWKIALTTFAEVLRILSPLTNPVWEPLKQWQSTSLTPAGASNSVDAETAETHKPINLPELLTFALGDLTAILPVILFIDNLDISDAATLEALTRTMLPALKNNPLLLIATFDPERNAEQRFLEDFLEAVLQIPDHAHFKLFPLQAADIAQFFASELGSQFQALAQEQQTQFLQQIYRLSTGNLARIEDVFYYLRQVKAQHAPCSLEALTDFQALFGVMFQEFSEDLQAVLRMAATQGFYFCLPAIARALELPENELSALLRPLSEKPGTWLRQDSPIFLGQQQVHWYRFTGKAHHAVVYESLAPEKRQGYHCKIASALECVYGSNNSAISVLLASQWEQGGMHEKAGAYYAMAAQQANNLGNLQQGFEYAEKGLQNLQELPMTPAIKMQRCRLLIQKGRAMQGTVRGHLALEVLREAYTLAQDHEVRDQSLQIESGNFLGYSLLEQNKWDEGIEITIEAIDLANEKEDWISVAKGMENLLERYYKKGEAIKYFAFCDKIITSLSKKFTPQIRLSAGLDLEEKLWIQVWDYEQERAYIGLSEILRNKGWLHYQRSEHSQALESFEQALEYLNQIERSELYPEIHYKIHRWLAKIFFKIGKYYRSLDEIELCIRWADTSYNRRIQALARYEKANILQELGQINEGKRVFEEVDQLLKNSSDLITLGELEQYHGEFLSHAGHSKRLVKKMYLQAYNYYSSANNFNLAQIALNNIAWMDDHLGNFEQALSTHQKLLNEGIANGDRQRQGLSLNGIGNIYRIQNHLREAEQSHLRVLLLCNETYNFSRKALTFRYLGRVYLVMGDIKRAEDVLIQSDHLFQTKAASQIGNYVTKLYLNRLRIYQNYRNLTGTLNDFEQVVEKIEEFKDLPWIGISYLNQTLMLLFFNKPEEALSKVQNAHKTFNVPESWRVSEAHHLLARCYLALGELEQAQAEITQAQTLFMKLKLFHRVHQAESTEIKIEEARRNQKKLDEYRGLSLDELRQDFNHLGI